MRSSIGPDIAKCIGIFEDHQDKFRSLNNLERIGSHECLRYAKRNTIGTQGGASAHVAGDAAHNPEFLRAGFESRRGDNPDAGGTVNACELRFAVIAAGLNVAPAVPVTLTVVGLRNGSVIRSANGQRVRCRGGWIHFPDAQRGPPHAWRNHQFKLVNKWLQTKVNAGTPGLNGFRLSREADDACRRLSWRRSRLLRCRGWRCRRLFKSQRLPPAGSATSSAGKHTPSVSSQRFG